MAVYGRHREKWDPTRRKAKVSKNNTLEITGAANKKLLFYLAPENLSSTVLTGTRTVLSGGGAFSDLPLAVRADSIVPSIVEIEKARFQPNAINFPKDGDTGNRCYVESGENTTSLTADLIAGRADERAYDTYISFWVKVPTMNFGTDTGHNLGGFYRNSSGSQSSNDATDTTLNAANLSPAILFNITASGTVSIRFKQDNNALVYQYYESNSSGKKLQEGEWSHVTFVIKRIDVSGGGSNDYTTMVDIYIDGENTGTPSHTAHGNANSFDMFNSLPLELILGNQEFGYQSGSGTTVASNDSSDGFTGAIGEFIIFSQPATEHASTDGYGQENTDGQNRRLAAKFIYEAQREGVFSLHSGIHSSSPRLEQFDLDNDSSYPPNFMTAAYTVAEYEADQVGIAKTSVNRFTEGFLSDTTKSPTSTVETYSEKASQRFVQSRKFDTGANDSGGNDIIGTDFSTIPHLRLNPNDTLLTNGNWYSDARSEFFSEDLAADTGFVITKRDRLSATLVSGQKTVVVASTKGLVVGDALQKVSGDGAFNSSGARIQSIDSETQFTVHQTHANSGAIKFTAEVATTNLVDDELYREHVHTDTVTMFRDITIPEEFKDTFVIEIPLHNTSDLLLSTDMKGVGTGKEKAELKTGNAGASPSQQDSSQEANTMAYYNFANKQWQHTVPAWSSTTPEAIGFDWQTKCDIGFTSMSGLVLPINGEDLEYVVDSYGRPTTSMGFPFHRRFESKAGQTIDLSKYLDESVILEGWEVSMPVIPKVGFAHTSAGADGNTEAGPSGFYPNPQSGKTPFYYGAHGEACVFWNSKENALPFEEISHTIGSDVYTFNGTVPVGNFDVDGIEKSPEKDAKGLVTKGVTAFLLKESTSEDTRNIYKKYTSTDKIITGTANNTSDGDTFHSAKVDRGIAGAVFNTATIRGNQLSTLNSTNTRYPFFGQDFYDIGSLDPNGDGNTADATSRYSQGSTRELIGYLQHVYHNDTNFDKPRNFWQRNFGTSTAPTYKGARVSEAFLGTSMQDILNRENNTLIPNLLRQNTDEYQLHVSGSMKGLTPYDAAYPINFFKMASDHSGQLDRFQYYTNGSGGADMDNAVVPYMHSYGFFPSSEGSTISEFVQRDMVPNIFGKSRPRSIDLPETSFPNAGINSSNGTLAEYRSNFIKEDIKMTLNPDPATDVILRPNDKLVLGVQDSLSTVPLSQQSLGNTAAWGGDNGFVRWGRNSITIPATKSGYLRLYVRKTRQDKPYNAVSDESNYNQNVNRDLGDHQLSDTYFVNNPQMFSGSIADDIMGPTTFTPPVMQIDVTVDTNIKDAVAIGGFSDGNASWSGAVNPLGQSAHYAAFSTGTASAIEGFDLKWYNASNLLFKFREEGNESATDTFPRFPAIPWEDTQAATTDAVGPGENGSAITDRGRQWFNCSMMFHWPLADPGTLTYGANGQAPYAQGNSTSGFRVRFRNFAHPKELNTNSSMTAHQKKIVYNGGAGDASTDISRVGRESPAMSAWGLEVMLPIFKSPSNANFMTPAASAINVEFRLVKILDKNYNYPSSGNAAGEYAKIPTFLDVDGSTSVNMKVGDAFYFYSDPDDTENDDGDVSTAEVNKQKIQRLDISTSATNPYTSSTKKHQRLLRNWMGNNDADNGPVVYIVAGCNGISSGSPGGLAKPDPNVDGGGGGNINSYQLTYKNIYSIISRVLYLHSNWDESILGVVENFWDGTIDTSTNMTIAGSNPVAYYSHIPTSTGSSVHDGNFKVTIPQDTVIRKLFSRYQTLINDLMAFKLCGTTIDANTLVSGIGDTTDATAGCAISNKIRFYKDGGGSDTTPVALTTMDFGNNSFGGLLTTKDTTHTIQRQNFISDYFLPMTNSALVHNGTAVASGGSKITRTMYQIDYSNLTRTFPILNITEETYNETINRRIDRFVQRRSTELDNKTDTTKPLAAGPFGSLKNYIQLETESTIFDSHAAASLVTDRGGYCKTHLHRSKEECNADITTGGVHSDAGNGKSDAWVETDYFTTVSDVPTAYPFEASRARVFRVSDHIKDIKVKLKTTDPGGLEAQGSAGSNSPTVSITLDTDTPVGNYAFGFDTTFSSPDTEGSLGHIQLTNYIQEDFKGNQDFTDKTVGDFLTGFGDGPQGRHVLRPHISETKAWTGGAAANFSNEFIMDKPRGARYGQYSTSPKHGTYVFMYNHYGHLRDMLEQSIDTKFNQFLGNARSFGSPVVVTAINIVNPEVPKRLENTSRFNKTRNATVSKPYIENGYENTAQPTNLNNDTLRVDVAGSLRSGNLLTPGNIASNIRNR